MSRGANRIEAYARALAGIFNRSRHQGRPETASKVLVLHELLLGDTLMLAPLFAALRSRYPAAEIFVTANPAYAALFSGQPYGIRVLPYSERVPKALAGLAQAKGCDIAILPADNRHAIAARAIGARWIVGFAGSGSGWRNRAVDELVALPQQPAALADMFIRLSGISEPEAAALSYHAGDWQAPEFAEFDRPDTPYAVLHVGAGSPLRLWEPEKWRAVADVLVAQGLSVAWSAGRGEIGLVREIDPAGRFKSYAGALDLAQVWHLLAGAHFAIVLDTGISHLAKLTRTPTAVIYGPGSAQLFGKGSFWRDNRYSAVTLPNFACRDQQILFNRPIKWVRRCNRTTTDCPRARCMDGIVPAQVIAALPVE